MSFISYTLALSISYITQVDALSIIATKGQRFFTSNGDGFSIKGVIYQATGSTGSFDSPTQCSIDATHIASLGANTIRLQYVEADADYEGCMRAFEDEGIYVLVGLSDEGDFTRASLNWTSNLRADYMQKMDSFQRYDNTLGFFVGDYAIDNSQDSVVAPYVKAAISDMKLYRDRMGYRDIPIGYAMSDGTSLRKTVQDYLGCDTGGAGTMDFFSVDSYSWCATNTMEGAGYDELLDEASSLNVPYFISGTGCNQLRPRSFDNMQAIYGADMSNHISGAIVKQWHEDNELYGLASYSGTAATGTPTLLPDYTSLSSQWAAIPTTETVKANDYTATYAQRACPTAQDGTWNVDAAIALPTLGSSGLPEPPTTTKASQPSETAVSNPSSDASRLGPGIIAALALGGMLLVAIVGTSIWFFCFYRARKSRAHKSLELGKVAEKEVVAQSTVSLPSPSFAASTSNLSELPSREIPGTEMTAVRDPREADSTPINGSPAMTWPRSPNPFDDSYAASTHRPGTSSSAVSSPQLDPTVLSEVKKKQKQMEVDFLVSEEAKLRQRREELMSQSREHS